MKGKKLDVVFWRQPVDQLECVAPGEGVRHVPATALPLAGESTPPASPGWRAHHRSTKGSTNNPEVESPVREVLAGFGDPSEILPAGERPGECKPPMKRRKKEIGRKMEADRERDSEDSIPENHPNFEQGSRNTNLEGEPLLAWSRRRNEVRLSSRLPSWSEDEEPNDDAFCVMFGLYGRDDAKLLRDASPRYLADHGSRAMLRATELAHQTARNLLGAEEQIEILRKLLRETETRLAQAQARVAEAEEKVSASKDFEVILEEELAAAETISKLESDLRASQTLLKATQVRVAEFESKTVVPPTTESLGATQPSSEAGPSRRRKELSMSSQQWSHLGREIAIAAGDLVFSKLKFGGFLTPEGEALTTKDIIHEVFAEDEDGESSDSLDYAPPPS